MQMMQSCIAAPCQIHILILLSAVSTLRSEIALKPNQN